MSTLKHAIGVMGVSGLFWASSFAIAEDKTVEKDKSNSNNGNAGKVESVPAKQVGYLGVAYLR